MAQAGARADDLPPQAAGPGRRQRRRAAARAAGAGRAGRSSPTSVERLASTEKNTWIEMVVAETRPRALKAAGDLIRHSVLKISRVRLGGLSFEGLQDGRMARSDEGRDRRPAQARAGLAGSADTRTVRRTQSRSRSRARVIETPLVAKHEAGEDFPGADLGLGQDRRRRASARRLSAPRGSRSCRPAARRGRSATAGVPVREVERLHRRARDPRRARQDAAPARPRRPPRPADARRTARRCSRRASPRSISSS